MGSFLIDLLQKPPPPPPTAPVIAVDPLMLAEKLRAQMTVAPDPLAQDGFAQVPQSRTRSVATTPIPSDAWTPPPSSGPSPPPLPPPIPTPQPQPYVFQPLPQYPARTDTASSGGGWYPTQPDAVSGGGGGYGLGYAPHGSGGYGYPAQTDAASGGRGAYGLRCAAASSYPAPPNPQGGPPQMGFPPSDPAYGTPPQYMPPADHILVLYTRLLEYEREKRQELEKESKVEKKAHNLKMQKMQQKIQILDISSAQKIHLTAQQAMNMRQVIHAQHYMQLHLSQWFSLALEQQRQQAEQQAVLATKRGELVNTLVNKFRRLSSTLLEAPEQQIHALEEERRLVHKKLELRQKILQKKIEKENKRAEQEARKADELEAEINGMQRQKEEAKEPFDIEPPPWSSSEGWVRVRVRREVHFSVDVSSDFISVKLTEHERPPDGTFMIRERRFAKGTFRSAFFVRYKGRQLVGKTFIRASTPDREWSSIRDTAMQYCMAYKVTRVFRKTAGDRGLLSHPKQDAKYVENYVVELEDGRRVMLEQYKPRKDWRKYNDNGSWALPSEQLPQALSHFSYNYTKKQHMLVDVQGFKLCHNQEIRYLFSDPGFHSRDGRWGDGDFEREGMQGFFSTHVCNHICTGLGLEASHL